MANNVFKHATIGSIKANTSKEGVVQFLGLQYATIIDRFAPAKMKEYSNESINATKLGPQVLSIAPGPDGEFGLIQHTLEYDRDEMTMSDTEGLCLNITVPRPETGELDGGRKLPVFAFIHGGGFNVGSGMSPQYNMTRFVKLSVSMGQPIIAVALNYRLGAPGLLTSKSLRERGYLPNNALRDQRTALLWLKEHIAGFGGDSGNITLGGESAGGISVCYHLFSKEPLFKRMISMSGTQLLVPPITPEAAEANYERAIKALGYQDGERAVGALTSRLDGKEMVGKLMGAGVPFVPILDDEICPTPFSFQSTHDGETAIPGQQWCEAAIIGDCQFDGNIQGLRLAHRKKDIASAFCEAMSSSLFSHPGLADRLCSSYELDRSTPDDAAFEKVLRVANDVNFYIPTLTLAQNLSTAGVNTFMYRFNEPNPWEGPWKGHATHIIDIIFLLQNFNEFLGEEQKAMAEEFGRDVVSFINGKAPWTEWKKAKMLGPEGKTEIIDDEPPKVGRRDIMLELGKEVGLDTLSQAFDGFLKGAKEPHT